MRYRRYVLQSVTERNTSAMELETVPDTEDYILLDKIGMGMGVYSGVYEYTQQIQEQIQSIQSIQVFGHLLSCRQDPCSIIVFLPRSETYWKTTIIRKWIPCRAAKQRVVFSSAASRS